MGIYVRTTNDIYSAYCYTEEEKHDLQTILKYIITCTWLINNGDDQNFFTENGIYDSQVSYHEGNDGLSISLFICDHLVFHATKPKGENYETWTVDVFYMNSLTQRTFDLIFETGRRMCPF